MSRCVAIHSLVFSLVILFQFATADDLELLSNSVSLSGLKDFLVSHQQSQISNKSINNVSDDGSPNAMSQADYDGKEQSDINDKSSSQTSNFGHALLELPLVSSSSNLTAQPSNYVASETQTASDEEATEPLYKGYAGVAGNGRADRLAGSALITDGRPMDRADIVNALREIGRLEDSGNSTSPPLLRIREFGVKIGIAKNERLTERTGSLVNQHRTGTISRGTDVYAKG